MVVVAEAQRTIRSEKRVEDVAPRGRVGDVDKAGELRERDVGLEGDAVHAVGLRSSSEALVAGGERDDGEEREEDRAAGPYVYVLRGL